MPSTSGIAKPGPMGPATMSTGQRNEDIQSLVFGSTFDHKIQQLAT